MKIAKFVANPFAALAIDPSSDDDARVGIPQGVVALPASRGIWLGARLDEGKLARTGKHHFYFPLDRQGKTRVIEMDVSDANIRAHIAKAILDGSLIAADEKTARIVGISEKEFLSVEAALAVEKTRALDNFQAFYGPRASIAEVPVDVEPEPSDVPRPEIPSRAKAVISKNLTLQTAEGK